MANTYEKASDLPGKKKAVATVAVFLALAEILFFNAMARTVGPYITADLGDVSLFTMMNTIFFLCSTCVMPIACKLGDKFGRSRIILIGIAIYSASMLLAGLSTDMPMHVLFRGGQGLGQGCMLANCLTAIGEIHDGPARAKYLGLYGTVTGVCNIFGPTLGGIIYETMGWRAVFYTTIVVGIIVVALLLTMFPNIKKKSNSSIDVIGFVLMSLAAGCAVFAFSFVSARGWTDPLIICLLVVAVAAAVAFVVAENKAKNPIISMKLFKNKYFVLCVIAACAIWPCMFSSNAYFTLYAQAIRGMSAIDSGAILSAQAIVNTLAGIVVGFWITASKGRIRAIMIVIIALYAGSMVLQSTCNVETPMWVLYVMMGIIGFGNGAVMGAFTAGIQGNVSSDEISSATATLQSFQSLTGTIGLSIMGVVLNSSFTDKLATVVPSGLTDLVPMEQLTPYLNAGALINAQGANDFMASLPQAAQGLFQTMMSNVNAAYASSLETVFIILTCLLAIALISMVLLKEKKTSTETEKAE